MINKAISTIIIYFGFISNLFCQDLKICSLSASEKQKGIVKKFQYESHEDYHVVNLILYANYTFFYEIKSFGYNAYSEGRWNEKENFISLSSSFQLNKLPVKIVYTFDSSTNNQKIEIVQNLKQEKLHDALVYVNNDSINCFPDMDCLEKLRDKTIDSLKVKIGDISSPWIKVSSKNYKELLVVIQTDLNLSNYLVLNNKKYNFSKPYLKEID